MTNKVEVKVGGKVYLMNQVTYSKTERTIFDWDSSYIEEFMRSGDVEMRFSESMDSSDVRMRVNEFGQIVQAPLPPEKPDRSKWKRMTPKRVEILAEYRMAKSEYDKELEAWLQLPFADEGRTREEFIHDQIVFIRNKPGIDHGINKESYYAYLNGTFDYEVPVFQYGKYKVFKDKKMVEKYTRSELPEWAVEHHEMEILEVRKEIQTGFTGNASQPRRGYKKNRDLDKDTEYDTDIETGEQRQQTLFNCKTSDKGSRIVDYEYIHRFEAKPNVFLSRMYLDYILNGVPINDWYKAQINKWIKKVRVSGYQSTL